MLKGRRLMDTYPHEGRALGLRRRSCRLALMAAALIAVAACNQSASTQTAGGGGGAEIKVTPPGGHPLSEATSLEEEFGEFVAKPEELANVATNDIVKSLRLNAIAMLTG